MFNRTEYVRETVEEVRNGFVLGSVDSQVAAITPTVTQIAAAKLPSVLSWRVATARDSLILAKKFST